MKRLLLVVLMIVALASQAIAANFYWKSTKAGLDGIAGLASGDRGIVIDSNGVVTFYYHNGSAWVAGQEEIKCAVFENLAAADDNFEVFEFRRAGSLTAVSAHCRGTCSTPATIAFEDRAGNAVTLASTLTASTGTGASTWINVSSGGGFTAGEGMAIDVTNAVSPETDEYTICFAYTVTAD